MAVGDRRLLLGLVNGVLVAIAKVPSIIVTLGTLAIFRSLLVNHAGGKTHRHRRPSAVARRHAQQHAVHDR